MIERGYRVRALASVPEIRFDRWRSGDQKYYVSDFGKFHSATGWRPKTGVRPGIGLLYRWVLDSHCAEAAPRLAGNA